MKKESIVYWSIIAAPDRMTRQNLLFEPPVPLRKEILSRVDSTQQRASYESCKSMHEIFKNTYMLKYPYPIDWSEGNDSPVVWQRTDSGFKDSLLIDTDIQWVFFSEDPIELEMTPPYMHNTEASKYGYIAAGSLDISRWFRTVNLTYQLWNGINELHIKANDPGAYITFRTPNKVKLQQFEMTEKLAEIVHGCESLKQVMPNLPLANIYERFTRSNRHTLVLKHIKENLI